MSPFTFPILCALWVFLDPSFKWFVYFTSLFKKPSVGFVNPVH